VQSSTDSLASAAEECQQETARPVFKICDLRKEYHLEKHVIPVLDGVSFSIAKGEWVSLVGRSGSGKTTLLHLLGSLDQPSSGDISFRGRKYSALSRRQHTLLRRDEIGLVFQSYYLFPELSASENVLLPALQWGWDKASGQERADRLLSEFGLGHRLRHRPQELSEGEQQRVALARALINEPDVILADEPTGNLDITASSEIIEILQRLHVEQGKTVVTVTHDLELAQLADRTLVLKAGKATAFTGAEALAE